MHAIILLLAALQGDAITGSGRLIEFPKFSGALTVGSCLSYNGGNWTQVCSPADGTLTVQTNALGAGTVQASNFDTTAVGAMTLGPSNATSIVATPVLNVPGGIDTAGASTIAIGATHSNLVTITPATTVTGALTASGGVLSTTLDKAAAGTLTIGGTNATALTLTPNTTFGGNVTLPAAGVFNFTGQEKISSPSDGKLLFQNSASGSGVTLDMTTDSTLSVRGRNGAGLSTVWFTTWDSPGAAATLLVGPTYANGVTITPATTVSGTLTCSAAEYVLPGTVSAPGVAFSDNHNTGLYESASNQISLSVAGTERLRLPNANYLFAPGYIIAGSGAPWLTVNGATVQDSTADGKVDWHNNASTAGFCIDGTSNGTTSFVGKSCSGTTTLKADSVLASGAVTGVGYTTGAGCTIAQSGAATSTVVCTGVTGQITTVSETLLTTAEVAFTVTDTSVAAADTIVTNIKSTASAGNPMAFVSAVAAGSFQITISNMGTATMNNTVVINFAVLKGSAS